MRQFGNPVVPVAVHKVLGDISLSLVETRIRILRRLHRRRHCAYIINLRIVRGEGIIADTLGDVGKLCPLAELALCIYGIVELAALEKINRMAVLCPFCGIYALAVRCKLILSRAVKVACEQIPAAAVLRDRSIAYPIENLFPVRRELRIRQPAQREHDLRSHPSVLYLDIRRSDISGPGLFFLYVTTHDSKH